MRLIVIAASNRQPGWVDQGFEEYAKRLRGAWRLELRQVALSRRGTTVSREQALATEGERLLASVPEASHVVALSERGTPWSTTDLVARMRIWNVHGGPVSLLIGGPDGLDERCLVRAHEQWSLSPLTLPHGLVRVVVAEALYRAWSVIHHHPYHRA